MLASRSYTPVDDVERRICSGARQAWSVWCAFVFLVLCHALGVFGQLLYPLTTIAASAAAVVGLRRLDPVYRRPWWILAGVGVLWTVAGVLRDATAATGDLSSGRSLWPDAFALPGYVLFGVALFEIVRGRGAMRDRGALIDGALVAVGSTAVVFSTVVAPTLGLQGAWLWARAAVAVYPAVSMWMLIGVVQLVLTRAREMKGAVFVVAGSACLQIGDVIFALGEIGTIRFSRNVLDVPYLMVAACLGAAALHPGVHEDIAPHGVESLRFDATRFLAVAVALAAPVVAMATSSGVGPGRAVQLGLIALTAGFAVTRIAVSARAESAAHAKLLHRATHDQLTGLPSHRASLA